MGKTSVASRLNLPGRIGWLTMEAPGFLTLAYLMKTLPEQHGIDDLPWQNKVLAGLFVSFPCPLPLPLRGAEASLGPRDRAVAPYEGIANTTRR